MALWLLPALRGLMKIPGWLPTGGLLFSMVAAAPPAAAQFGQIVGVVADATGVVLPGALRRGSVKRWTCATVPLCNPSR